MRSLVVKWALVLGFVSVAASGQPAEFSLVTPDGSARINPGGQITVEVFLVGITAPTLLAGYEATIEIVPVLGSTGSLGLVDPVTPYPDNESIFVDTSRPDWVFFGGAFAMGMANVYELSVGGIQLLGTEVPEPKYCGTYVFLASADALGDFQIDFVVVDPGGDPDIFPTSLVEPYPFAPIPFNVTGLTVSVGECQADVECNDGDVCTDDTCVSGVCENTNNTAPCEDELFCTSNDTCSGGLCVGGPDPCLAPSLCSEDLDACVECLDAADCDDGNVCTNGLCSSVGACENRNNTVPCAELRLLTPDGSATISPGEQITVEVFVSGINAPTALSVYDATIEIVPTVESTGSLGLVDPITPYPDNESIFVDASRPDWVFFGVSSAYGAANVQLLRVGGAAIPAVAVPTPEYCGTYVFEASADALGDFQIDFVLVDPLPEVFPTSLWDANLSPIPFNATGLTVTVVNGNVPAVGTVGLVVMVVLLIAVRRFVIKRHQQPLAA